MPRLILLIVLFSLIVPSGCKTSDMNFQKLLGTDEPERPLIEKLNPQRTQAKAEEAARDAAAVNATAAPVPGIAIPEKALVAQRLTIGVARNTELEEHLNAVLERLQAVWPGQPVPSCVFVRPSPEFRAFAQKNAIIVDYGLVRALESEDELAAMLAHEYSHILLHHASLGDLGQCLSIAYGIYDIYNTVAFHSDGKTKSYITKGIVSFAVDRMNQNAFIPIFSREQEEQADALGADLLLRAGYSPMGVVALLNRLESWETQQDEIKKELELAEQKARNQKKGTDNATEMINSLFTAAGDVINKLNREHYPPSERLAAVKEYIRTFYADIERKEPLAESYQAMKDSKPVKSLFSGLDEMEKAKMALYAGELKEASRSIRSTNCQALMPSVRYVRYLDRQIALATGKAEIKTLEKDCKTPDPLLWEYEQLIGLYEKNRKLDEAVEVAETAFKDLDKTRALFPTLIRLNQKIGRSAQSISYLVACRSAGDPGLSAMCSESAQTEQDTGYKSKKDAKL
ncbi:MAG: M48 family metalloprotease [Desulfovibrionaceae bacterium]